MTTGDGRSLSVEVTGRDRLDDPVVNGVIYEVRPAHERHIFQRVLAGVASGGDAVKQLDLIMELVAAAALDIDAAVVGHGPDGSFDVVTATRDDLRTALERAAADGELRPFAGPAPSPTFAAVGDLDGRLRKFLGELGYVDAWHVDVSVPVIDRDYRIVAFTPVHHIPAMGVIDRLNHSAELAAVVLVRVRSDEMLDWAAHHDPLTDLPNRLGLRRRIDSMSDDGRDFAVLFVDLDGFKLVNDRHGHAVGDAVLRQVAGRLASITRTTDLVARLGGDEFAVVLGPASTHPDSAAAAAAFSERILEALEEPIVIDGVHARVSASIGLVSARTGTDIEAAVERADRAMYVAKSAGGGRFHDADRAEPSWS